MQILIVGSGGREHALAWKVAQSPQVSQIWVAPGNAGTALEAKTNNVAIAAHEIDPLLQFARNNHIDLTIVGPELPLSLGIVDQFHHAGLRCFGPTQRAAQLESSKVFSKNFLRTHAIPTARYANFTDATMAIEYALAQPLPLVIKADGLAAGKGVVIAQSYDEAQQTIHAMLADNRFGSAGHRIIIEEYLAGEELSYIVMTDGYHILPLASSQDHKRRDDGDKGPNTGGMGAFSPARNLTEALEEQIINTIIRPTIQAMSDEGNPYLGFLYAGLMIGADQTPRVLEFNCRLGDPETQPLLMRLQSDLVGLCMAALEGQLDQVNAQWDQRPALGVVMTADGYPLASKKGDTIVGLDQSFGPTCQVFQAATKQQDQAIVTDGGRVLCVTALGETLAAAHQMAYDSVAKIHWPNCFYRKDIGVKSGKTDS